MEQNIPLSTAKIVVSMGAILLSFAVLDVFWLGWYAQEWYQIEMAGLMRAEVITWPWGVFYTLYGVAVFILAVLPNRSKSISYAALNGAVLGAASYGAYNLTNYSILANFSLFIALLDWGWGIFLTMSSAIAGWWGLHLLTSPNSNH
ncbi:DUF2177 family protein [Alteromonas flava]|uniref:DUF2177 family protein n=1 Tax=Alteromonas flava TaxID=2048003 RepID=UPI000C287DCD|nr:DUF2177 family protein [Alteromonas flava]